MKRMVTLIACTLALGTTAPEATTAQTVTWTSLADGFWSQDTRWSPTGAPDGPTVDVRINGDFSPANVTLDSSRMIRSLDVGSNDGLIIEDGNDLTVAGSAIENDHVISQNAASSATDIRVGAATLSIGGSGDWFLSDSPFNRFVALSPGNILVHEADHRMVGSGTFGAGTDLGILNYGTIEAEGESGISIDPGAGGNAVGNYDLVNRGRIDAGQSTITLVGPQRIDNTNGVLAGGHSGGAVVFDSSLEIRGGELLGDGGNGAFVIPEGTHNLLLADLSIGESAGVGTYGATVELEGTISIAEDASIQSHGLDVFEIPAGGVTFTGGGLFYGGGAQAATLANADGPGGAFRAVTLDSGVIMRAAFFAGTGDHVGLVNRGTIESHFFDILIHPGDDPATAFEVVNEGVIEANTDGEVRFLECAIQNDGGILRAESNSANLLLDDDVLLDGGLLELGTLKLAEGAQDVEVRNLSFGSADTRAELFVDVDEHVNVSGTLFFHQRSSELVPGSSIQGYGSIGLADDLTLSGHGQLNVLDRVRNEHPADLPVELRVEENGRIFGQGFVGLADNLGIRNEGVIEAILGALFLNPGAGANVDGSTDILNQGVVRGGFPGGQSGSLVVQNGSFRNEGTVEAGEESFVGFGATSVLENLAGSFLQGGTWTSRGEIDLGGEVQVTKIGAGTVVELSGVGQVVAGPEDVDIENTCTDIDGTLRLSNGRDAQPFSNVSIKGTLDLGVGSDYGFPAGSIAVSLATSSTLSVDIVGEGEEEYGQLATSGPVVVDGTLRLILSADAVIEAGDMFVLVSGSEVSGTFDATELPNLEGDLAWTVEYGETTVTARVDGSTSGVGDSTEDVSSEDGTTPGRGLRAVLPNPFQPSRGQAEVSFALSEAGAFDVSIYAPDGRRIRSLENQVREAGLHSVRWNGEDDWGRAVPAGVYFVQLNSADSKDTRKVVVRR